MAYQVVQLVVGPPGTGKSYQRAARWVADEFMPNRTGVHFSNFPIDVEAMAEYCQEKHGLDPDEVRRRIQFIPDDVLEEWRNEEGGPWEYFADDEDGNNPLDAAHVAFDECHVYLPRGRKAGTNWRKRWEGWLGTIRHRGCTVEFITQDESKVAMEIVSHCESKLVLSSGLNYRLPLIGITFSDFYQLAAKLTGRYRRLSIVNEYLRKGNKWENVQNRVYVLEARYFALYNSHNATEHGEKGGEGEKLEWERFTWPRLLLWFWRRNWFTLSWRGFVVSCIMFFFWGLISGHGVKFVASIAGAGFKKPKEVVKDDVEDSAKVEGEGQGTSREEEPRTRGRRVVSLSTRFVGVDGGELYTYGEEIEGWKVASIDTSSGAVEFIRGDELRRVRVGGMLGDKDGPTSRVPRPGSYSRPGQSRSGAESGSDRRGRATDQRSSGRRSNQSSTAPSASRERGVIRAVRRDS